MSDYPKPFLKYPGGKDQLLAELVSLIPKPWLDEKVLRYHEPFLGGGALLLALWRLSRGSLKAWAGDANAELIDAWWAVTNHPEDVAKELDSWPSNERTFYRIRAMKPWKITDRIVRAARTIYLNKNCFNGLFRLGPDLLEPERRNFNVPWGKRPGARVYDANNFRALEGVEVSLWPMDFRECTDGYRAVEPGDLCFMDPPYVPVKKTSMTDYGSGKFTMYDHEDLAGMFERLVERGAHCMLCNSDVPWVRDRFGAFDIHEIEANRAINRDGKSRTGASELIIVGSR